MAHADPGDFPALLTQQQDVIADIERFDRPTAGRRQNPRASRKAIGWGAGEMIVAGTVLVRVVAMLLGAITTLHKRSGHQSRYRDSGATRNRDGWCRITWIGFLRVL